jgi:hypothetical protein
MYVCVRACVRVYYVPMIACLCPSLTPEWLDAFYECLVLEEFIDHSSVIGSVNINTLTPKIGSLQTGPNKQNGDFLEERSNDF